MAAALLSKAVGFLMIPVYTHYLSTADYGRLELLDLTATLIAMLTGMGIGTAAMRYYYDSDDPPRARTAISTAFIGSSLIVAVGASLLIAGSWPLAASLLDEGSLYPYVILSAVSLFLDSSCAVAQSFMRIQGRSGLLASISLLRLVIGLSLNILFVVVFQFGVVGVLLGGVGGAAVAFAIQATWLVGQVGLRFDAAVFGKLWRYGFPLVPSAFATFVVAYVDRFLLRNFGTLDDVGVYSLAYKFGFLVQFLFIGPFHTVWDPRVFDVAKRANAPAVFARILTYWCAALLWGALGLSLGAYELIPHISPEPYWPARTYVVLIAAAYALNGLRTYAALGLLVTDRTHVLGTAMGALSVPWILVYALLIWKLNALGGALGTFASYGGNCVVIVFLAQRAYRLPIEWRRLLLIAALAVAVYFAGVYCTFDRLLPGATAKVALLLAYPLLLLAAGFVRPEEKAAIRAGVSRAQRAIRARFSR